MHLSARSKFFIAFLAMIGGAFFLLFAWYVYEDWNNYKMVNSFGGKTPQETLQMYIDAVEKGDYELASTYFIQSHQKEELAKLQRPTMTKEIISTYISWLKRVLDEGGDFAVEDRRLFIFSNARTSMALSPEGIWKIIWI